MDNMGVPNPDRDEPAGRVVVGRYRLDRVLGRGAMGVVWAGYDLVLRRPVAVKEVLLPPGLPEREADLLRERTLREARAIAVLSHPNVVTLYDVARHDGDPFVVMELVASRSLSAVLRAAGPLDIPQAAAVADAVAAALEAAHRAGITHRDVKPGNVLVAEDGRIKLTDFGIARNLSEPTMTTTGIMLGTPAFIAPEVASGRSVTPAADLWGLGVTLFAALEGRAPYEADGPLATVHEVVYGEVPKPTRAGPLEEVVTGLMVKEPAARMPLAEVRRQLKPLLPDGPALLSAYGHDGEGHADDEHDALGSSTMPLPDARPSRQAQATPSASAPLAADPGPLPFPVVAGTPGSTVRDVPRRRGRMSVTLVALLATVLFVSATGTGFVLVRMASGRGLLPPTTSTTNTKPVRRGNVETHVDTVAPPNGQGGRFSVDVPAGWTTFLEQRAGLRTSLPQSTVMHFVSPDGQQDFSVERFANCVPAKVTSAYLAALGTAAGTSPAHDVNGRNGEPATETSYRIEETPHVGVAGKPSALVRAAVVRLQPQNNDLWVLRLAVPDERAGAGRTLFGEIVLTFSPAP
jgi:serine/threonine protein kinase